MNDGPQVREVLVDGLFAGVDERLEPERLPFAVPPVGLTRRVLLDVEAKEVQAHTSLVFVERVRNSRLLRVQAQSHPTEELLHRCFGRVDARKVMEEDDEIIGKPNHSWSEADIGTPTRGGAVVVAPVCIRRCHGIL